MAAVWSGNNTGYFAGNLYGAKILQNANPLIAFNDIKTVHKFIAFNRIPNAFFQVNVAKRNPLGREFTVFIQKGHKIAGKGCTACMAVGTDNAINRNIIDPQRYLGFDLDIARQLF